MKKTGKITILCNQKGGVGKTVTAVNLGIGLAAHGKIGSQVVDGGALTNAPF